jgi:hypothetical protein
MIRPVALALPLLVSSLVAPVAFAQETAQELRLERAQDHAGKNAEIEELLGDADGFMDLYFALQDAVDQDNAETVAGLVDFPLRVSISGEDTYVGNEAEFVQGYEGIVTPAIKQALMDQDYDELFVSSDGVMVGDGAIWFVSICADDACNASRWAITNFNS